MPLLHVSTVRLFLVLSLSVRSKLLEVQVEKAHHHHQRLQHEDLRTHFYHLYHFYKRTMNRLLIACVLGGATLTEPAWGFGGLFDGFQNPFAPTTNDGLMPEKKNKRLVELKQTLLEECRQGSERQRIEEIIADLQQVSPVPESATSPLLQRKWLLEWTTEKEINIFIDWNISNLVTQTIDGPVLENCIDFSRGGFLGVTGSLSTDGGVRTNFEFTEATLDLGGWGSFKLPPVGKGWFDTVYLDDNLRVDTNSRDDILICTSME